MEVVTRNAYYLSSITSPLVISAGVGLFNYFGNRKPKHLKIVNYLATMTFPVYLIHDNCYFRDVMWKNIFNTQNYYGASMPLVLFHMFSILFVLFLVAVIVEALRKRIESVLLYNKMSKKITNKIDEWYPV